MTVNATGIPHAVMHWEAKSFEEHVMAKYGLTISGVPPELKIYRDPASIWALCELRKLIRLWERDTIRFERLDSGEFDRIKAKYEVVRRQWSRADRGSKATERKRRNQRGVVTVGMTGKGLIKSPEFILDSDVD